MLGMEHSILYSSRRGGLRGGSTYQLLHLSASAHGNSNLDERVLLHGFAWQVFLSPGSVIMLAGIAVTGLLSIA